MSAPIEKREGLNASEKYVARIAEKTFLDLWCYPNLFQGKRTAQGAGSKELCDLLICFDNEVTVISVKSMDWPRKTDISVSWSRWYKRVVEHSVKQINGAIRWIMDFPDRIFLDPQYTKPFPIELPPVDKITFKGIAVTIGAKPGARKLFRDDGSMGITPGLVGRDHIDQSNPEYTPFYFGDVNPGKTFVHVFDEDDIRSILNELDTAPDFLQYLSDREILIRNRFIPNSPRETNLLAEYLSNIDDKTGRFHFPRGWINGTTRKSEINLDGDRYKYLKANSVYKDNRKYLSNSYRWDYLINLFTRDIITGESVQHSNLDSSVNGAEYALRCMAKENRFSRAYFSEVVGTALGKAAQKKQGKFVRFALPPEHAANQETGYVFLVLAYPTEFELERGYEQYRETRTELLLAHCEVMLYMYKSLKRVVGVAFDQSPEVTGRSGGSEDLALVEVDEWTEERLQEAERIRAHYQIMRPDRVEEVGVTVAPPSPTVLKMSRQQRRAQERKARKKSRSRRRRR